MDVSISSLPAPGDAPAAVTGRLQAAASWEREDEVVAALTSSGRLVLARSVEEDLWQETLEVGPGCRGTRSHAARGCFACQTVADSSWMIMTTVKTIVPLHSKSIASQDVPVSPCAGKGGWQWNGVQ